MTKLTGTTVAELIAKLQALPPDALVVTEAGDATVAPLHAVETGYAYQYTPKNDYGGTHLLCREEDLPGLDKKTRDSAVLAVWVR